MNRTMDDAFFTRASGTPRRGVRRSSVGRCSRLREGGLTSRIHREEPAQSPAPTHEPEAAGTSRASGAQSSSITSRASVARTASVPGPVRPWGRSTFSKEKRLSAPGTHQRASKREPQNRAGAQAAQSGPRSGADFERAIRKVAAHQSTGACPKHTSASKDRPTFHVKHHGRPPHLRASPRLEGPPPSPPRSPRTPRRAQASSSSGRGPRDAR